MTRLDEIRQRWEEAQKELETYGVVYMGADDIFIDACREDIFIDACREDIPFLLAEVERLQKALEYYAGMNVVPTPHCNRCECSEDMLKSDSDVAREALAPRWEDE